MISLCQSRLGWNGTRPSEFPAYHSLTRSFWRIRLRRKYQLCVCSIKRDLGKGRNVTKFTQKFGLQLLKPIAMQSPQFFFYFSPNYSFSCIRLDLAQSLWIWYFYYLTIIKSLTKLSISTQFRKNKVETWNFLLQCSPLVNE
jgi:hypothetical protein